MHPGRPPGQRPRGAGEGRDPVGRAGAETPWGRRGQRAMLVVSNYTARWRVEEFHRVWKSGALRIEESQLRSADNFERLARIAASVAVRILRLTYLARTQPDLAAHHESSELEYRALQLLDPAPSSTHTIALAQAFRLLADIGGYTGKSSGGPRPYPRVSGTTKQRPCFGASRRKTRSMVRESQPPG